jgi:drug/metabolite transporter (DMT)-like permease
MARRRSFGLNENADPRRVWSALLVVYLVWGSTYLGIRVAVETIPPFLMVACRFLVAGAILYALSIRRGETAEDHIGPRQWIAATVIGGLLLLGGNGLLSWAEQRGVATGVAALLIAAVPLYMVLIAALMKEERVRLYTVVGLVVGFAGTAMLVRVTGSKGRTDVAGLAAVMIGSVSWAAGSVLSRRMALPKRPLVSTAMEMLCGGALVLVTAAATGEFARLHPSAISAASVGGLLYLIAFGSLVAFSSYVWLLQNAPMSLVSTYAYVNPIIAVLLGAVFLGERFSLLEALASALIVVAVAVIVLGQSRSELPERAQVDSAA